MYAQLSKVLVPLCAALFTLCILARWMAAPAAAQNPAHLGYGFNVAEWNIGLVQDMGFDWIKVFSPPGDRLPVSVLLRIDANAGHLADLSGFRNSVAALAQGHGDYLEAYEIGNEVNLDAGYGWAAPPDATAYVSLLCEAYTAIKQADSDAIVVSAGLAPTGRVNGTWNGHPGHSGFVQDEREFLREFLAAGGADCADVIGYHPYGFSADFDAEPDIPSNDPEENCANGFCFRGVEMFYDIMQAEGAGDKMVWATEFGWIIIPPDECLSDPSFQGREWQLVTPEKQAANLAGAFEYADTHWPWMGGMFIFNLNFNAAPWYQQCEQMRYYAVQDRPAEAALREMPKNPAGFGGRLVVEPGSVTWLLPVNSQPMTLTTYASIGNGGWVTFIYTATVAPGGALQPLLEPAQGTVAPGQALTLTLHTSTGIRPAGDYTAGVQIEAAPDVIGAPETLSLRLMLAEEVSVSYLPVVSGPN